MCVWKGVGGTFNFFLLSDAVFMDNQNICRQWYKCIFLCWRGQNMHLHAYVFIIVSVLCVGPWCVPFNSNFKLMQAVTYRCVSPRGFCLSQYCATVQLCGLYTDVNRAGHLKLIFFLSFEIIARINNANWDGFFQHVIRLLLKLFFKLLCNLWKD